MSAPQQVALAAQQVADYSPPAELAKAILVLRGQVAPPGVMRGHNVAGIWLTDWQAVIAETLMLDMLARGMQ